MGLCPRVLATLDIGGHGGRLCVLSASDARKSERATESEREGRRTWPICCRPWPATPGQSRRVAATRRQRPVAGRPLC